MRKFLLGTCLLLGLSQHASAQTSDESADTLEEIRFDCLIEPMMVVAVGSPVQGVLETLEVRRSDLVIKGQVLARLNSNVEEASLAQAKVRAQMSGEMYARQADLELTKQKLTRTNELYAKRMISSQLLDEAKAEHQVAKMALRQAEERKQLSQSELAWANEVVERRTILSPIDGVVIEPTAFPGEFVYDNPIVKLAQIDPLRVEVLLPSRLYEHLRRGMQAHVYPELGGQAVKATVSIVDRMIDTGSSTFGAELELPNPDHLIPSGQKCEIVFGPADQSEALALFDQ